MILKTRRTQTLLQLTIRKKKTKTISQVNEIYADLSSMASRCFYKDPGFCIENESS